MFRKSFSKPNVPMKFPTQKKTWEHNTPPANKQLKPHKLNAKDMQRLPAKMKMFMADHGSSYGGWTPSHSHYVVVRKISPGEMKVV